jgi:hypothetical protein
MSLNKGPGWYGEVGIPAWGESATTFAVFVTASSSLDHIKYRYLSNMYELNQHIPSFSFAVSREFLVVAPTWTRLDKISDPWLPIGGGNHSLT